MSDPNRDMLRILQANEKRLAQTEVKEVPGAIPGFTSFYATGTFTPIFLGSTIAGTFTYTLQNGNWTRTGNIVHVQIHISISAITVAPTGNLQIGSLPITSTTPDPGTLNVSDYTGITLGAGYSQLGLRVNASATTALLIKSGSAIQALAVPGGALALITGAAEFVCSGAYRVA